MQGWGKTGLAQSSIVQYIH
uniref:Uncharacterized protein n=1 Tax=Anguilla anguilla TaxID=7936 RepID=A0A0E9SU82_ANGAN